jgi:SAM-dependent methyltransferase
MTAIEYQYPSTDKCVWSTGTARSKEPVLNVGRNVHVALETATRSRLIQNDHILIVGNGADQALDHLVDEMDFNLAGTSLFSGTCRTINQGKTSPNVVSEQNGSLPFITDAFDVVLCTQFLNSYENATRRFDELLRVIKPVGSLCIAVQDRYHNHLSKWLPLFKNRLASFSPSSKINSFLKRCTAWRIVRLPCCDKSQAFLIRK